MTDRERRELENKVYVILDDDMFECPEGITHSDYQGIMDAKVLTIISMVKEHYGVK